MKMKKKTMVYTGAALSALAGTTALVMMNQKTRKRAEQMIDFAIEETKNYFEEM
ncbi:MAG: hypothetical protein R3Y13_02410 [bacterium]